MARKLIKRPSKAKQGELGLQNIVTGLYIRVSTEKQASEGHSLDAQRSELETYCQANGWHVSEDMVFVDAGISGKSTDRPAFQAMMQAAQDGKLQRIVCTKLDRIARNLRDLLNTVEELKNYRCSLVCKKEQFDTGTAQGIFFLQLLGAVGELERSMISERVHSGRVENAKQGGFNGARVPYGYSYGNGEFAVNEKQAAVVRDIFAGFVAGESLSALADCLNTNETPTATGGKWYAGTVRYILRNGLYAGLAQWDGVETQQGDHPAIIDRATYEAAHKRLQSLKPGKQAVRE